MRYSGYAIRPVFGGPDRITYEIHPPNRPRAILATTQSVRDAIELIDEWNKQLCLFDGVKRYGC